ncbi:hypothetical protein OU5_P0347 (plasmid) [Pseudomonas mandelii JR-1]|jgi:hypothetical protein|uniref:HTH cro/C1-type domain-containing protein n=2 Tax=Pseudomonas TaxID=286 RepID=A0A024EL11_9PSED|nr:MULTISPECIES: hypothetical protein [Pseudomonas]AHZ73599.1 hypothetical protein OU5_P0347 [Pseudomonas mandelii JR-1]MBC2384628.1 hypothetical protein [Pseudomonas cremoris]MBJ2180002.1 hypothetical protein [Pseudomonas veronii]MBV7514515.1 hypothetical protein [Pseudomonas sp. PDM25]MDY7069644.1 hypothetical protein [Pseudomonas extremaustralis]
MQYSPEAVTHEAFVSRVQELMKRKDLSATKLAHLIEEAESTVKNMLYKGTSCPRERLIVLARALETTVEYLSTGSDVPETGDAVSLLVQTPENLAYTLNFIPHAPAEGGVDPVMKTLPIPLRLLSEYGLTPDRTRAVSVNTDAMAGVVGRNDIVLVDITRNSLDEGVFLIAMRNSVLIRQVSPVITGFALTSTNPNIMGTTVSVTPETGDLKSPDTIVIGKLVCKVSLSAL